MLDPYVILGVSHLATDAEIKAAYRGLVKQHHPDMDPGNRDTLEMFRRIQEAYDQINREAQRNRQYEKSLEDAEAWRESDWAYDKTRWAAQKKAADGFFNDDQADVDGEENAAQQEEGNGSKRNAEEVLADFFGGLKSAGRRAFKSRGKDVTYHLKISLEEASLGTVKRVRLASGKRFNVKIPPGVKDGQTIRMSGHGKKGSGGGGRGDTLIVLSVKDHPYFTYHGANIHMELPVTVDEAVLGARVSVPTLEGSVVLKIPEGSNTDSVFRLRGKGRVIKGKTNSEGQSLRGDQYISLKVVLPKPSDRHFTKLVRRWAARSTYGVRDYL